MNELIKRIRMLRKKNTKGYENSENEKNIPEKITLKVFRAKGTSKFILIHSKFR